MTCPSDHELLAFANGTLDAGARRVAEEHLDGCPTCIEIVAALADGSESPDPHKRETPCPRRGPLLDDGEARYVPHGEIARGGMGRILSATDRLLGRTVALKRMRGRTEALERRFRREQRITARLEHPAILPVYDAGFLDDGEPFFAMRLVKGERLDRAAGRATSLEERLRLLPSVLAVVDAVAYAHGEGVVHRDLKPQNVLVGPFGEVVLLDWGLARELGSTARETTSEGSSVTRGAEADQTAATLDGEGVGTPAYMAPEQVDARAADARSDVFGLGAMLFHVVAGKAPDVESAAKTDPHAARATLTVRLPDVPADLADIVDRAMARDPARRYASARELAEDLKRWQAGRLVEAHRYTLRDLFKRFVRRYRAPIMVAAAAIIVLATFGTLAVRRILTERAHANVERRRAERARTQADTQRAAAERLVAFVLGDLRSRLERVGRLDALAGVAKAVSDYQHDAPVVGDRPDAVQRSEVAGLAGDVAFAVGDLDAAEERYQQSAALAGDGGDEAGSAEARCRAALRLGDVSKRRGSLDAATGFYETCKEPPSGLPGDVSDELSVRANIALAEIARIKGDLAGARKILEGSRDLAARVADRAGGAASDVSRLRQILLRDLGVTLFMIGEVEASRAAAAVAVDVGRARVAARMDDQDARFDLASALALLGIAEQTAGDLTSPEPLYREALETNRALVARDPSNAEWLRALGVDADRMGTLMTLRKNHEEAVRWLRQSKDNAMKVAAIAPSNFEWQHEIFLSEVALAQELENAGHHDEARTEANAAFTVEERLRSIAPDAGRALRERGSALSCLANAEYAAGRTEAGNEATRQSVVSYERALSASDTPAIRQDLASGLLTVAAHESGAQARADVDKALETLAPVRSLTKANPALADIVHEADEAKAKLRAP